MTATIPQRPAMAAVSVWRLSRTEVQVGTLVFLLSLVARFQTLLPGYSIDDFAPIVDDQPYPFAMLAAQGRALLYYLHLGLNALGASPTHSGPLSVVVLTLALVAVGVSACRLWGASGFPESLIVASLVALHPYQSEVFTFRTTGLYLAIPLGCSFAALITCTASRGRWILSLVLLVCSLSLYQIVLNYLIMSMIFSLAFHFSRMEAAGREFWPGFLSRLKLILAGTLIYYVSAYSISHLSGVALSDRAGFIGINALALRAKQVLDLYEMMFFRAEAMLPFATKVLLLITLGLPIGAYLVTALQNGTYASLRRVALSFALIFIVGLPLCIGMVLVLGAWWPVPRVLAQTGMFWAGSIAFVYRISRGPVQRAVLASVSLIIVSFIGISNHVFKDQLRVNMRDMATANRIVARVEALPEFTSTEYVVLSGGSYAYRSPITTMQGDMNISALFAAWSKLPVLNEVSGYAFQPASAGILVKANAFCETAPKWPAAGSVARIETGAVVCMEK
jgi:hypothetical protein